jgi:hypothetical protein
MLTHSPECNYLIFNVAGKNAAHLPENPVRQIAPHEEQFRQMVTHGAGPDGYGLIPYCHMALLMQY